MKKKLSRAAIRMKEVALKASRKLQAFGNGEKSSGKFDEYDLFHLCMETITLIFNDQGSAK